MTRTIFCPLCGQTIEKDEPHNVNYVYNLKLAQEHVNVCPNMFEHRTQVTAFGKMLTKILQMVS
jgi:hypothetical protein